MRSSKIPGGDFLIIDSNPKFGFEYFVTWNVMDHYLVRYYSLQTQYFFER